MITIVKKLQDNSARFKLKKYLYEAMRARIRGVRSRDGSLYYTVLFSSIFVGGESTRIYNRDNTFDTVDIRYEVVPIHRDKAYHENNRAFALLFSCLPDRIRTVGSDAVGTK